MSDAAAPPRPLRLGESLPLAHAASNRNARFALGALGGRFTLFCVIGDANHPDARTALAAIPTAPSDETQRLCAIFYTDDSIAPPPALSQRLIFTDAATARECRFADAQAPQGRWLLLDPNLRVMAMWSLAEAQQALSALSQTPSPDLHAGVSMHAPVLITPRVFEPEFCQRLIAYYAARGGIASGVTKQDETGRTFVEHDDSMKRRADCLIDDAQFREGAMQRIFWRLATPIERAFMWRPTRMERYLIARYDAGAGFFKPHRDNTTKGTAHRRFAVTINLNAEAYEGGDLRFPEFGSRTYRAPTGGAVVFSCGLLHEATPVTKGERYAFVPFLYDEAAAKVRQANNKYLDESLQKYRDV